MVLPEGGRPADASALAPQRVPFDARLQALARVWEAAADETFVDHPICPDCAAEVQRELELRLAELQQEAAAYEAAAQRLEALQAATGEAEGADGEAEAERRHAEQLAEARREVERERCAAPTCPAACRWSRRAAPGMSWAAAAPTSSSLGAERTWPALRLSWQRQTPAWRPPRRPRARWTARKPPTGSRPTRSRCSCRTT